MSETGSNDLVDFLIDNKKYFSQLCLEDKLKIKDKKPTPDIVMEKREGNDKFVRRFQRMWYINYKWLTGSLKRNRLFCYYCLLFSSTESEWCTIGVGAESLKNMTAKLKKHECTAHHIYAAVKFNEIGKVRTDHALSKRARVAAIKHNEKVDQNRLILKRLISTTCFLARQELSFPGLDESDSSLNKGNYLEILDFLAEEEPHLKNHLIHSSLFKGTSLDIQSDLIQCVTEIINEQILAEIKTASFVSIQADETTDVSVESKLSVILRYANMLNGEVEERFVGFYDVSQNKTAQGLADILAGVLKKWEIDESKLVCQTYDGASTMANESGGVHSFIKQIYPHALFIHCYAHQLNLLLLHACKTIKDVKLFVANLTAFHNFFSHLSKRTVLLRDRGFKLPLPSETIWNYHSRGVSTILAHYSQLKAAFQNILDADGWDGNSINLAIGLKRNLEDPKFVFLLHLYNKIFESTNDLFDVLHMKNININRCNTEVKNCLDSMKKLRSDEIIQACVEEAEEMLFMEENENEVLEQKENADRAEAHSRFNDRLLKHLKVLSFEILDNATVHLESRFQEFCKLDFIEILNNKKYVCYKSQNFPNGLLKKLTKLYPFFDVLKLKGELMFIYGSDDKQLPPKELFKFLIFNDLKEVLPETIKLLSLILSIPVRTASCDRSMNTLTRIKTFLCHTMLNEQLSNLATLAIEKGLVKLSSTQQEFISRVIDVFAEKKDRGIDLVYKKI